MDLARFGYEVKDGAMLYYDIAVFALDLIFGIALLWGLIRRNFALIDLMLVILKVYDGTFFILKSLARIDAGHINLLDQISNYFLLGAGILSLITLLFFCFHYYYEKNRFWNWIMITVILTGFLLLVSSVLSIINHVANGIDWPDIIEASFMCVETFAVYFVCRYVRNYE